MSAPIQATEGSRSILAIQTVRSVTRAVAILEVLANEPDGLGLVEVSDRADVRYSTCHRLLRTLIRLNCVIQHRDSGRYLLGYKVLELASLIGSSSQMVTAEAKPILSAAMMTSGETASLAVREGQRARYVAQVPSDSSVRMIARIGGTVPLHATGVGKVLLAYAGDAVFEAVAAEGLSKRTARTIVDRNELAAALCEIRRTGYGVDHEEFEEGVMCVAAPVRDHTAAVVAAISVSGPSSRVGLGLGRLAAAVLAGAASLSTSIGCPNTMAIPHIPSRRLSPRGPEIVQVLPGSINLANGKEA